MIVLSMIILVLTLVLTDKPTDEAVSFHTQSTLWIIMMTVAGLLVGPKGMMVYVHLIALGPWKACFS